MNSKLGKSQSYNLYSCSHLSNAKIHLKLDHSGGSKKFVKYCSKPNPSIQINSTTGQTTVFLPPPSRSILKSSNELEETKFSSFKYNNNSSRESSGSKFNLFSNFNNNNKKHQTFANKTSANNDNFNNRFKPNILKTKTVLKRYDFLDVKSDNENKSTKDASHRKRKQVYNLPSDTDLDLNQTKEKALLPQPEKKKQKIEPKIEIKIESNNLNLNEEEIGEKKRRTTKRNEKKIAEGKIINENYKRNSSELSNFEEGEPLKKRTNRGRKCKINTQTQTKNIRKKVEKSSARVCPFVSKRPNLQKIKETSENNLSEEEIFINLTSDQSSSDTECSNQNWKIEPPSESESTIWENFSNPDETVVKQEYFPQEKKENEEQEYKIEEDEGEDEENEENEEVEKENEGEDKENEGENEENKEEKENEGEEGENEEEYIGENKEEEKEEKEFYQQEEKIQPSSEYNSEKMQTLQERKKCSPEEFPNLDHVTTEFLENSSCPETSIEALLGFENFKGFQSDIANFEEYYFKKKKIPFPVDGEFLIPDYLNYINPYDFIEFSDDVHKLLSTTLCSDFIQITPIKMIKNTRNLNENNIKLANLNFIDFDENFNYDSSKKNSHMRLRNALINGYSSEEFDYDNDDHYSSNFSNSDLSNDNDGWNEKLEENRSSKQIIIEIDDEVLNSKFYLDCEEENSIGENDNTSDDNKSIDNVPDSPKSIKYDEERNRDFEINIDRFKCHECDITFGKQRTLDIHQKKTHSGIRSQRTNGFSWNVTIFSVGL
ncbi:probable WRKY transcription factor protein 1 isoform X2 [Leptopilina heterotoma]|uniref:probable WRKY transcription factor protein 1 isoform X2 n=1 Tax=Leptopilina heterotoma TaxID=63436 RepID=UPI001CA7F525|nr:probable WRKY transcription factor protein 1 isoform X2 [Leptopilina heterotoma]